MTTPTWQDRAERAEAELARLRESTNWRAECENVLDVWQDSERPWDDRHYVSGTYREVMKELAEKLAAPPAQPALSDPAYHTFSGFMSLKDAPDIDNTESARQGWNACARIYGGPIELQPAPAQPAAQTDTMTDAKKVCAQVYQVVGSLLDDLGQFNTDRAGKVLDNLSAARIVHEDVLPWPSFAQPAAQPVQLTEVEILKAYTTATGRVLPNMGSSRAELIAITRIIERAHGIAARPGDAS